MTRVELVCQTAEDALRAEALGADRIELCAAIETGGLTPSAGVVREILRRVKTPLVVMVRPRPSGFCYTPTEQQVILADAAQFVELGVEGLVFGCVEAGGTIDEALLQRLVEVAKGVPVTFHRVFDSIPDPIANARRIVEMGVRRLLCSGSLQGAEQGIATLRGIKEAVGETLEVIAAGGIRSFNAGMIVQETGCDYVHLAPLTKSTDATGHFGLYGREYSSIDTAEAARVIESVRSLGAP